MKQEPETAYDTRKVENLVRFTTLQPYVLQGLHSKQRQKNEQSCLYQKTRYM